MSHEPEALVAVLDHKAIMNILPHRYPFLLVDRVVHLDLEKNTIIGQKNVSLNEEFFKGHFPFAPLMPGVLIIEALAQTGGILIHKKGYEQKIALLMSVNNVKFRKPVLPGDILFLHVEGVHFAARGGKIKAQAKVNGQIAVEAEIGFGMVDKTQLQN
jgi:3-hydroxyacyl-[acyl-carrier-protein] dehydratase